MIFSYRKNLLPEKIYDFKVSVLEGTLSEAMETGLTAGWPDYEDLEQVDRKNVTIRINGILCEIISSQGGGGVPELYSKIQDIFTYEYLSWLNNPENYHLQEIENVVKSYWETIDWKDLLNRNPSKVFSGPNTIENRQLGLMSRLVSLLVLIVLSKWRLGRGNCNRPPKVESLSWENGLWLTQWKTRLVWIDLYKLNNLEKPFDKIQASEKPVKFIEIISNALKERSRNQFELMRDWKKLTAIDQNDKNHKNKSIYALHYVLETWGLSQRVIRDLQIEKMNDLIVYYEQFNKDNIFLKNFELSDSTSQLSIKDRFDDTDTRGIIPQSEQHIVFSRDFVRVLKGSKLRFILNDSQIKVIEYLYSRLIEGVTFIKQKDMFDDIYGEDATYRSRLPDIFENNKQAQKELIEYGTKYGRSNKIIRLNVPDKSYISFE